MLKLKLKHPNILRWHSVNPPWIPIAEGKVVPQFSSNKCGFNVPSNYYSMFLNFTSKCRGRMHTTWIKTSIILISNTPFLVHNVNMRGWNKSKVLHSFSYQGLTISCHHSSIIWIIRIWPTSLKKDRFPHWKH